MFVLKRRDIRGVAANCYIKVLTIFCCFAGPVYISVLFALGQDGEKFIHHELFAKMKQTGEKYWFSSCNVNVYLFV